MRPTPPSPPPNPRTDREVIDEAIRENRFGMYLLYGFASMFVLVGLTVLTVGMARSEGLVALAGAVGSTLFYPAFRLARQIRDQNMPCARSKSPSAAQPLGDGRGACAGRVLRYDLPPAARPAPRRSLSDSGVRPMWKFGSPGNTTAEVVHRIAPGCSTAPSSSATSATDAGLVLTLDVPGDGPTRSCWIGSSNWP